MHFVPFDVDGAEGTRGTQILAGSTAYATTLVDGRDVGRLFVVGIGQYHLDGSYRTMTGTVVTTHPVIQGNTVLLDPDGMSYLGRCLHLMTDGLDSPSGAYF